MDRREALVLLAALPYVVRLAAQTKSVAPHRFALSQTAGLLLDASGIPRIWNCEGGSSSEPSPAMDRMGLGHNNPVKRFALYPIPGLQDIVAVAASNTACYAVRSDGRVLAWGSTGSGELGITSRVDFETAAQPRMRTNTPTPVAVPFDAVDISTRGDHVLARARDGSVYAWGRGDAGQLGVGPLPAVTFKTRSPQVVPYVPYPVRVSGLEGVVAIGAGTQHSVALMKDGTVRAWGSNRYGQIGDNTSTNRDMPTVVPGVRDVVAIAAGGYRSVAVLANGTVMEWGANHVNLTPRRAPVVVQGAQGIRSVVAGDEHVVALTRTRQIMTWGQDAHYQIGRSGNAHAAGLVTGLADVETLAAGADTSIVVLSSGKAMTWGEIRSIPGAQGNLSRTPIAFALDGL